MTPDLVHFETTRVAVLEHQGPPATLMSSGARFIQWRKASGDSPISTCRTFGIIHDDPEATEPAKFRFDICAELRRTLRANDAGITARLSQLAALLSVPANRDFSAPGKSVHLGLCSARRRISDRRVMTKLIGLGSVLCGVVAGCTGCGSPEAPAHEPAPPPAGASATESSGPLRISKGVGSVSASGIARGTVGAQRCRGHFAADPQHTMVLAEPMTGLQIEWDAADVVLEVRSGNSHWCSRENEQRLGRGAWSAGEYALRFGTVAQGSETPYTLTVRELK
jgi:hypothetical protein